MDDATLLDGVRERMPVAASPFHTKGRTCGLIVVDIVNGFATVGGGALVPAAPNAQVDRMVAETDRLAGMFLDREEPVMMFLDSHEPGRPEPPYPPHCEIGTGEEELVSALAWLAGQPGVTLMAKDCINGFIGGFDAEGRNTVVDWIEANALDSIVVVGICTDICVMDFVLTLLSARNHGMTPSLRDVVVYEPGCATYDLPRETALALDLPETLAHPQQVTHHLGLYFMASRGAAIASAVI